MKIQIKVTGGKKMISEKKMSRTIPSKKEIKGNLPLLVDLRLLKQ